MSTSENKVDVVQNATVEVMSAKAGYDRARLGCILGPALTLIGTGIVLVTGRPEACALPVFGLGLTGIAWSALGKAHDRSQNALKSLGEARGNQG